MKKLQLLAFLLLTLFTASAANSFGKLREPWMKPYAGDDATGKHVIALWSFDGKTPLADASGHGHPANLDGAKIHAEGRFGSCLQSFPGWPVEDKRHRVSVKNHQDLSPQGAFTIEMWINPDQAMDGYLDSILVDKKYVADTDYQISLGRADRNGSRNLRADLGFGASSKTWNSDPIVFEVGAWRHIAFTYDGLGTGHFFVDGQLRGKQHFDGVSSITPGQHALSIGDRVGSLYHGFPGRIDQVRISHGALEFRSARFARISNRSCFVRMEKNAELRFSVTNLEQSPLSKATISWSLDGQAIKPVVVHNLKSGEARNVVFEFDTKLRPDFYRLEASMSIDGQATVSARETFQIQIVPRKLPNQFPVVMWGAGPSEIDRLKKIGFTHSLGLRADNGKIWKAGKPTDASNEETVQANRAALDNALANGITLAASLSPGSYLRSQESLLRVDRSGKPIKVREDICALNPKIEKFCYNVGASMAKSYGDHPAFGAALLHSEVRGHSRPCFHERDFAAYRKATGKNIPAEAGPPRGVDYKRIKGFPTNRVIADNDPIYTYYRWHWKKGDGWNGLNTQLNQGLKTMRRPNFWTWYDPAVRVASVYGAGGDVDIISHWTYSYPDPIRIGLATDELLAMAGGATTDQQTMKMTQLIWYRSQTAPIPKAGSKPAQYQARWEREQPQAPFITIPPMHLREALWTKIARPIRGIMYHGWQSLVPTESTSGYRYTNPQTQHELARLIRDVVQPLGPTLLNIPGVKSDIACYESFASQVYARRGTYGWNGGWIGDAYHVAMWAGLQPEIVYDETIVQNGLDDYRVLMMFDCDVITKSIAKQIKRFQSRGGIVVGDNRISPAIKPDVLLTPYQRTGYAQKDKAAYLKIAEQLRGALAGKYRRYVDSNNPNVIPYRRRFAETDYIFVVNDNREYGRYVGQHGLVMENGLPANSTISINRQSGFVYDLIDHRQLKTKLNKGRISTDIHLGPCDGRLLMVSPQAIERVVVKSPIKANRGDSVTVAIEVVDQKNRPVNAVIPLEVTIEDAESNIAEFSGYYAATGGKATIQLDIAKNDPAGIWKIEVRELASGRTTQRYLRVIGDPIKTNFGTINKNLANPVQPAG